MTPELASPASADRDLVIAKTRPLPRLTVLLLLGLLLPSSYANGQGFAERIQGIALGQVAAVRATENLVEPPGSEAALRDKLEYALSHPGGPYSPDDTECYYSEAASCCGDPAGQCCDPGLNCCGPGAYWCGRGEGGYCLPFWNVWGGFLWFHGDYLLWWTDGMAVPPLVTTSPDGTGRDNAGVLGQDTSILFGQSLLDTGARSGGRFTLGYWFGPNACAGIQATYLGLGEQSEEFHASSDGTPILARPFFNVQTGEQDAHLIAFPDLAEGSVAISSSTSFQEVEVLLRRALYQQCSYRLDFLVGYQYSQLDDELRIYESLTNREGDPVLETVFDPVVDLFDTTNSFHGALLGLVFQERVGRWSLEMLMKLGLGNTHSQATIDGSTIRTVVDPPSTDTLLGGGLAMSSNIAVREQDNFTMIPELGVTLGYEIMCGMRATVGYTFVYWSSVARAGDSIDLDINTTQSPFSGGDLEGEPRPRFSWETTDFWAQGLNFGVEYVF